MERARFNYRLLPMQDSETSSNPVLKKENKIIACFYCEQYYHNYSWCQDRRTGSLKSDNFTIKDNIISTASY